MELFRIQIGHLIYKRVCSVASWENKLVCFLSSSGMKRVWKRQVADSFFFFVCCRSILLFGINCELQPGSRCSFQVHSGTN